MQRVESLIFYLLLSGAVRSADRPVLLAAGSA